LFEGTLKRSRGDSRRRESNKRTRKSKRLGGWKNKEKVRTGAALLSTKICSTAGF